MLDLYPTIILELTDYIPQKQGLRLTKLFEIPNKISHRLYSTKTRIKTVEFLYKTSLLYGLTDYIPQKQGLRLTIPRSGFHVCLTHRLYSTKTRIKTLMS